MDSAQDRRLTRTLIIVCPAFCAVMFAWPTFDAPFQPGDDYSLILGNPLVRAFSFDAARELATSIHSDLYQPLPMLSYQLNFALSGENPRSYHLVNVALHAICAVLAAALAKRLSGTTAIACLTGVLFAVHPMAMDAVGWIAGRILLLAAFFSLALLNLFAWRRPQPGAAWACASILSGAGIVLSKVIPGVPLAAAWIDAWSNEPIGSLRKRTSTWWLIMAMLFAMSLCMAAISIRTERTVAMVEAAEAGGVPAGVRMLLALRYYIENYFAPKRLTVWSPVPHGAGWHTPGVWIALIDAAALGIVAWFTRRRAPLVMIGTILFALLLAPFLMAVGVRNFLTADRYMYLPMIGLHLTVASAIIEITRVAAWQRARIPVGALVFVGLISLLAISRSEAAMRRDIVAVARRAMELYPEDVRIPVKLAKIYIETGRPREALATVADARRRWPDDPALAGEAGAAYRALRDWNAALPELQRAVAGQPDDLRARYHLALTLDDLNQPDAAAAHYREILATRSDYVPAATALARNRRRAGQPEEALAYFEQALKTNPRHRGAVLNSASILEELGRHAEAEQVLRKFLALSPEEQEAALYLQAVLSRSLTTSGPSP